MSRVENRLLLPPDIFSLKKAVFIQPHPDDNEIGAGGTILRLAECGCEIYGVTVTNGDLGWGDSRTRSPQLAEQRKQEALNAYHVTGMQNAGFLAFEDQTASTEEEISERILEILEKYRPDGVFTCDPNLRDEWHSDHLKTGRAVVRALKNYSGTFQAVGYYFTDQPNVCVDVTKWQDKKMQAIRCHKSQVSDGFLELLDAYYTAHGERFGIPFAEPLRVLAPHQTHCWNLPSPIRRF